MLSLTYRQKSLEWATNPFLTPDSWNTLSNTRLAKPSTYSSNLINSSHEEISRESHHPNTLASLSRPKQQVSHQHYTI